MGGGVGGSVVSILSHGVAAAMFPRAAQDEGDGGSGVMQQLWPQLIDTDVQPLISLLLCLGGLGGAQGGRGMLRLAAAANANLSRLSQPHNVHFPRISCQRT